MLKRCSSKKNQRWGVKWKPIKFSSEDSWVWCRGRGNNGWSLKRTINIWSASWLRKWRLGEISRVTYLPWLKYCLIVMCRHLVRRKREFIWCGRRRVVEVNIKRLMIKICSTLRIMRRAWLRRDHFRLEWLIRSKWSLGKLEEGRFVIHR